MKIGKRLEALRRSYPRIGPALYLHATKDELRKRGNSIILYSILWSDEGRVSLHRTEFKKKYIMTVPQWADWLQANVPDVMRNSVLAYANRAGNDSWNIDRIVGWHFN